MFTNYIVIIYLIIQQTRLRLDVPMYKETLIVHRHQNF